MLVKHGRKSVHVSDGWLPIVEIGIEIILLIAKYVSQVRLSGVP